jgi:hypothetical protein
MKSASGGVCGVYISFLRRLQEIDREEEEGG